MKIYYLILIITIIGCSNISNNDNLNKLESNSRKVDNTKNKLEIIEDITPEKLSNLFFQNNNFSKSEKKSSEVKMAPIITNQITNINSGDYKVLVDWMVEDTRYIKLKNIKTNEESVIKVGNNNSSIVLIERNLFYYKFKINGQIVEVKR